jgi:uncharacterized protein DUF397
MIAPDLTRAAWRKSSFSSSASNCVEVAFVDWRKSSFSTNAGNCVEVAFVPHAVAVRDSKNTAGPTLAVPTPTWHAFVATL